MSAKRAHSLYDTHDTRVSAIAGQVRAHYDEDVQFRIFHGSSNSTRAANRQHVVEISSLYNVLSIDKVNKTATVEPGLAIDSLLQHLIPFNLMPAVIPDFSGIAAGGAFAGTAAVSSSFKYGWFDSTIGEIKTILDNGEIVRASPALNSDLFFGSAGAMGTLGITTLLQIRLVDCKPYVRLTYHHTTSQTEALARLHDASSRSIDFTGGLTYSDRHSVVIEGQFVEPGEDDTDVPVVRFTRATDPWFFAHVHKKFRCDTHNKQDSEKGSWCTTCYWIRHSYQYAQAPNQAAMVELVPLQEYLFHYDHNVFCMAYHGWTPNLWNRFSRWLLDSVFHMRFMYRVLHLVGGAPHVLQDLAIPDRNLCPIKYDSRTAMHTASTNKYKDSTDHLISIDVWGAPNNGMFPLEFGPYERFKRYNTDIEERATMAGGLKWLYAQNWYTEEDFWAIYDKLACTKLLEKWSADRLPDVWGKVRGRQHDIKATSTVKVLVAIVWAALGLNRLVIS